MYKSKLEEYCRCKSWPLPEYTTSSEGPPHSRRFKAVVVVTGVSYETKEEAKSSKSAQNEAARIAYERLHGPSCEALSSNAQGASDSIVSETTPTDDGATFDDQSHLCKNQLQIYAQKRNIALPTYLTEREGPPHLSRFKSKVSINGSTYEGPSFSKTVKQAQCSELISIQEHASKGGSSTSQPEEVKRLPGGKVKKKERQEVIIEKVICNKRKCITRIKLADASKKLGKKFATGASVVKGPTEKEQIDVQGDISYDIVEFITDTWPDLRHYTVQIYSESRRAAVVAQVPTLEQSFVGVERP
ncbi:Double-stranded RNA-binding protein 1-like protein [Drosera capensis]